MTVEELFKGVFDTELTAVITPTDFLACVAASLAAGVLIALFYAVKARYTKSFVTTLALLPTVVCVVIMMVNGNIGTGVAVAGAFSLVRFRSVPGSAREIAAIFSAMGTGLVAGMGYLAYSVLFAVIVGLIMLVLHVVPFGERRKPGREKTMKITVPEDLDYAGLFDDLFKKYTDRAVLTAVKTTGMGSMYKLTYALVEKRGINEKEFIDELRCRNGNLEINIHERTATENEL